MVATRPPFALGVLTILAVFALACDDGARQGSNAHAAPGAGASESEPTGRVLVSAAASLTDAFDEMAAAFEAVHPAVEVTLNLAGSSTLATQILEGAPVDVFAPADSANMARVAEAGGLAGDPTVFAQNRLQIAVPPGNPAGVGGLADFARDELLLGLCAEAVPCGDLARKAMARAGLVPAIDTHEPHVRALLTKVELGELDAAVTYVTDVTAASGAVEGIDIAEEHAVVAEYPIAVLARAADPERARAFVDFVLSSRGRAILDRHGFGTP